MLTGFILSRTFVVCLFDGDGDGGADLRLCRPKVIFRLSNEASKLERGHLFPALLFTQLLGGRRKSAA